MVLYNFIAVSLVRKAKDDVCAVALYQSPTSVEVYYAKNRPWGENADSEIFYDKSHAETLAALIRTTAKVRSTARQFGLQYFQLLHNNFVSKNCVDVFHRCNPHVVLELLDPMRVQLLKKSESLSQIQSLRRDGTQKQIYKRSSRQK